MKTGMVPYHLEIGGSGVNTTIPKMLLMQRDYFLKGKKACFLPLGASYFSLKNWLDIRNFDREMCLSLIHI